MTAATAPPPVREEPGRVAELRELSRTTPGVLIMFTAALVVVSVLVGVFTAISVQSRAQALDDLATSSGALSDATQDLYVALSDADATANSAFLSGGLEPPALRDRYEKDIAQAEHALAIAVAARAPGDVADPNSPLSALSSRLSVYTGLVETARTYNRQALPVGAAYQREASSLMRTELLPAARNLYTGETDSVSNDQDRAASWPIVEVLLGLVMLVLLYYAQGFVRRRTRRRVNVGLLVATGATLVSVVWVLLATIGVMANVDASRDDGSTQTKALAEARSAALEARGNETLTLVARGSGAEFEHTYTSVRGKLAGQQLPGAKALATDDAVRQTVQKAIDEEVAWHRVHDTIRKDDDGGDYDQAVKLAIGDEQDGAAVRFDAVDDALGKAIGETTASFDQEVSQASNALTGTVIGVILLALITAGGAVTGIWQRLKEYR